MNVLVKLVIQLVRIDLWVIIFSYFSLGLDAFDPLAMVLAMYPLAHVFLVLRELSNLLYRFFIIFPVTRYTGNL